MPKPKQGYINRTAFSNAIRNDLYEWLQKKHDETDVPISKLLDRCVEAYQEKLREKPAK